MKTLCLVLALFCLAAEASAKTVYCTNCSTKMTQAVEKATSVEQLRMLLREYDESIQQTAAQLQMVQQNIDQYALTVDASGAEEIYVAAEDYASNAVGYVYDLASLTAAECPAAILTDVNKGAWYHEAVDYVRAKDLMEGEIGRAHV